jgi:hypothetical protein
MAAIREEVSAKQESFGFLPWIVVLASVIVMLLAYICAATI